jgi:hypothetical protein
MKRIALLAAALLALAVLPVSAASVTVIGKLIDRQCSVDDVYGLQPSVERYCVLSYEETKVVLGVTYRKVFTVYCPLKTVDGIPRQAYYTCSDPAAMQIRHPTAMYSVSGELRTEAEQQDGRGQILGNGFSY